MTAVLVQQATAAQKEAQEVPKATEMDEYQAQIEAFVGLQARMEEDGWLEAQPGAVAAGGQGELDYPPLPTAVRCTAEALLEHVQANPAYKATDVNREWKSSVDLAVCKAVVEMAEAMR